MIHCVSLYVLEGGGVKCRGKGEAEHHYFVWQEAESGGQ